jgi:hypothetical protein
MVTPGIDSCIILEVENKKATKTAVKVFRQHLEAR